MYKSNLYSRHLKKFYKYFYKDLLQTMEEYEDLCMRLYWDCQALTTKLVEGGQELDRKKSIISWLDTIDSKYPRISDFKPEYSWYNVETSLTIDRLGGQVALLDFFTYCCINCMHILPDLERLEDNWGRKGLMVVGAHSAKFENEKVGSHLKDAISRYNIRHPVCNDSQATMWGTLGVTCWPTQLILGPHGRPVWVAMGEGHAQFTEELVDHYGGRGMLTGSPVEISENAHVGGSVLLYHREGDQHAHWYGGGADNVSSNCEDLYVTL